LNIYRQLAHVPTPRTPIVATIGNFDGVHLGHQAVIAEVLSRARFLGGRSLAITFDPHPARVLRPDHPTPLITPLSRRLELLAATGLDATLVLPFTGELRHMPPRDFVTGILIDALHVTEVHEGENFRFGYHAEAGVTGPTGLEALGRELGFGVTIYAPRIVRRAPVSSSRIRKLLTGAGGALSGAGNVSHARALLGRPFAIDSTPAEGRGYGRTYAVPTINLAPYPELLPAHGVYITTLTIGDGPDAEAFDAVTNVGNRPTFGIDSFAVESHLLNFHPLALTEQTPLRLTFLRRLRAERVFPTTQALRDQIARDVARARRYFALCRLLTPTSLP
jgi:riboflavin kinase/FMN adenylyltransferase